MVTYYLINSVENSSAGLPELYEKGNCFIGVDVARRGDLWVAIVLERVGDILWLREMVELKNKTFYTQEETLAELIKKYKVIKVAIDQTGMGETTYNKKIKQDSIKAEDYAKVQEIVDKGSLSINSNNINYFKVTHTIDNNNYKLGFKRTNNN